MLNLFKNKDTKLFDNSREDILNASVNVGIIHVLEAANTIRRQQFLSEEAIVNIPQAHLQDYMTTTLAVFVDDKGINGKKISNEKLGKLVIEATYKVIGQLPKNIQVQK
ncbi:TPA: hypothetical protein ACQYB3_000638 [Vibrio parahaemolyticus]|uniref:hypothetical protein n=2 Tax=Vibrio harveyi group TaxID=717610 RepID=UPI003753C3C0|nr:hypothetical protein [Vibrio alginolyticus]